MLQAIFSTAISHANSASLQQWSAIVATGNSAQPFILVGSQAVVLGSTYSYSVYYLYSNGTTSKYVSHRQEATGSVESLCQSPQTLCHCECRFVPRPSAHSLTHSRVVLQQRPDHHGPG